MCLQIIKKMEFNIRMGIYLDVRAGLDSLTQGARCHVWWPSRKSKLHMLIMVGAIWQPTSSSISLLQPSLSSISPICVVL